MPHTKKTPHRPETGTIKHNAGRWMKATQETGPMSAGIPTGRWHSEINSGHPQTKNNPKSSLLVRVDPLPNRETRSSCKENESYKTDLLTVRRRNSRHGHHMGRDSEIANASNE